MPTEIPEPAVTLPDRIAQRAIQIRPVRALLMVLAAPLYAAGFMLAVAWIAVVWLFAAAQVGWSDARSRHGGDL